MTAPAITDEQRAAVEWLQRAADPAVWERNRPFLTADRARVILAALPSELTNPQPVLPPEPGHYEDDEGRHWLHQVVRGDGDHPHVDQWVDPWGAIRRPEVALHRLERAHPTFTVEDIAAASVVIGNTAGMRLSGSYVAALHEELMRGADQ